MPNIIALTITTKLVRNEVMEICAEWRGLLKVLFGQMMVWPSGLRRWFKAPVFSEAWVRIPPLP